MIVGFLIALQAYVRNTDIPARFTAQWGILHAFLYNKWYFDEIYDLLFVRPSLWLGRLFWKRGDEKTIDRFGPDGAATAVRLGNVLTARLQSGYLYTYALVMLLGLAAAATWAMAR
jgi:NADH-quinone oxidoreductase subunit L